MTDQPPTRVDYDQVPLLVAFPERADFTEVYGGGHGVVALTGRLLRPVGRPSSTVLVFMHPTGVLDLLPLPHALAAAGVHVLTCASRYPNNDAALVMEKVVVDLGEVVRHARSHLGYTHVVLAGWSGGGALALYYQAQAERPDVTATPAGDPPDLTAADLPPADAVLQLAAHVSRATTLTEWMDASILDEADPARRDPELDLYDPRNPHQPPYDEAFLARYRAAQVARNRRITAWVKELLADLDERRRLGPERAFVVHGTMADPRWLDPTVDPNQRRPGWCYLGDPKVVNTSPAGLGRYSSLRSWLSQWSIDDTHADGPRQAARITVPVLVVENAADDACTPSHTRRIFEAVPHPRKEVHTVAGATHYYLGQPEQLAEATRTCVGWLRRSGLLDA
ncbi:MAG: alpha/beta fold hydrolase [Acidimicrobiales bacterium]|nr:alpha/beta fold hydrolase [Acidimicrobiales bacterium]